MKENIVVLKMLMAQSRLEEARYLAEASVEKARKHKTYELIPYLILSAIIYKRLNEKMKALQCIQQVVSITESENLIDVFICKIDEVRDLLRDVMASSELTAEVASNVADLLLQLSPPEDMFLDSFTKRETEVVRLLAQGASNHAISQSLDISLSTTKFHLSNIYQKLEVHSKAHALIKVKEMNFL